MTNELDRIIADVAEEQGALERVVAGLAAADWELDTPSEGWRVRDQITHLAFFDEIAARAITEPAAFAREAAVALRDLTAYEAAYLARGRALAPAALILWWRGGRARLAEAAATVAGGVRVPWYGPPMSAASFLSARLMECWLHGHDIVDALGIEREETDRLRHIVFLGVRARPFSYAVRGREPRTEPVRLELTLPSGARWADGDPDAGDRITGKALDFCRVVTHRRHVGDTALSVEGDAAREWMALAQAFAGPPAPGRAPGQFARRTR